jgi:hypothetical protein
LVPCQWTPLALGASRGGTVIGCQVPIRTEKLMACWSGTDTLINIGGYDWHGKPFTLMETHRGG